MRSILILICTLLSIHSIAQQEFSFSKLDSFVLSNNDTTNINDFPSYDLTLAQIEEVKTHLKGRILLQNGKHEDALKEFNTLDSLSRINTPELPIWNKLFISIAYLRTKEKPKALLIAKECLDSCQRENTSTFLKGKAQQIYGNVLYKYGKLDEAFIFYKESFTLFETIPDSIKMHSVLSDIGGLYFKEGQFEKALETYRNVLEFYTQQQLVQKAGKTSLFAASCMLKMDSLNAAELNDLRFLIRGGMTFSSSARDTLNIGQHYNLLATLEKRTGNVKTQKTYRDSALLFLLQSNSAPDLAKIKANRGNDSFKQGRFDAAKEQFLEALEMSESAQYDALSIYISGKLSKVYLNLGDYEKALEFKERQLLIDKAKQKRNNQEALTYAQVEFETERQQNKLLEVENTNLKNQQTIQSQQTKQNYLLGSGLFALLIGGYALRSQRKKRKASELALIEREAAAEREVEELMQQHRYANLAASIDTEEKERDRLSKELHDGVGSTISGIAMQLEAIRNDEQVESLSPLLVRLRSSYDELRTLSRNIGMPAVKENTLVELTGTLLANVQADSSLQINYVVFPKEEAFNIDQRIEISVYRIIQEAMNNIMKHAQASKVEVQLTKSEAELDVMIEDDGKGFDANVLAKGIGLKNMKDRVEAMGGEFHIDARLGKGTILSLSVPLKK